MTTKAEQVTSPERTHAPVLVEDCIRLLGPALTGPTPLLVDGTVGLGGHAEAFLRAFPNLHVLGVDRDAQALASARKRLQVFGDRFTTHLGTYDEIPHALAGAKADGILLDLGVSSLQLDEPSRGFSYSAKAPLDMRMDQTQNFTAETILNEWSEGEIRRVLRQYGEERFAARISQSIVNQRQQVPYDNTAQLVDTIRSSVPAAARRTGGHPAKRTFQALRIAVNGELDNLESALPAALASLRVGGRLAVEAYHSLEDRLVKKLFAKGAQAGVPAGLPLEASEVDEYRTLRLLTRGAIKASPEEIEVNPRSASVRLRAAELLKPWREHGS